jgi:hypothetical protein
MTKPCEASGDEADVGDGFLPVFGWPETSPKLRLKPEPKDRFGSCADLQHPLKHRRLSARNEAFGAESRQSARSRTFRRGWVKVVFVPEGDLARTEQAPQLGLKSTNDLKRRRHCQNFRKQTRMAVSGDRPHARAGIFEQSIGVGGLPTAMYDEWINQRGLNVRHHDPNLQNFWFHYFPCGGHPNRSNSQIRGVFGPQTQNN